MHDASRAYVERLAAVGARLSISAVGTPYDKAKAFFKTLKREEVRLNEYRDLIEARESLGRFIDEVYNQKRLYSSLGYRPPTEFEASHIGDDAHRAPVVR